MPNELDGAVELTPYFNDRRSLDVSKRSDNPVCF
mgnify:CR=1 FL=1